MRRAPVAAGLVLVVAWLAGAASVTAETGVSIDLGRVSITERLNPGGTYQLPTIGVRNPGSERTDYRLVVSHMEGQAGMGPPADWFAFVPDRLSLDPGETRPVRVTLRVPSDAEPGEYAALIGAQIASERPGAGVGAAAASRLSFSVAPAPTLEARLGDLWSVLVANLPWIVAVLLLVAGGLGVRQLRRRFTVTIARRSPP
jgi:hypothetical protein